MDYISGVFFDITERRHAEEALRESEARFASFMRHLPGTAVMRDFQGRYLYANEAWEKIQHRAAPGLGGQDHRGGVAARRPRLIFSDSDQQVITQGEPVQNYRGDSPRRTASTTGWSINFPSRTKTAGRS